MPIDPVRHYQQELSDLIYEGRLLALSNKDLIKELPNFMALIDQVEPFKSDKLLHDYCRPSFFNFDSKIKHRKLKALRLYLTRLQATMKYFPFSDDDGERSNILPIVHLEDKPERSKSEDLLKIYADLSKGFEDVPGFASIQEINGDGNCYYRAVLRAHIEAMIMAEPANRSAMFNHMANLFEEELLKKGSIFRQKKSERELNALNSFIEKLRNAAKGELWTSVQECAKDLMATDSQSDDYVMIQASRYLLGQYILDHLHDSDPDIQPLSFFDCMVAEDDLEQIIGKKYRRKAYESLEHYAQRKREILAKLSEIDQQRMIEEDKKEQFQDNFERGVLKMGHDAEGFFVELSILPAMLGAEGYCIIFNRKQKLNLSRIQTHIAKTLNQNFFERHHLAALPKSEVYLLLDKKHYTYLLTAEQQDLKKKFLMAVNAPRLFDFNDEAGHGGVQMIQESGFCGAKHKATDFEALKKRNRDGLNIFRETIDELFDFNLVNHARVLFSLISEQCRSLRSKHITKLQDYIEFKLKTMESAQVMFQDHLLIHDKSNAVDMKSVELREQVVFFEKKKKYWSALILQLEEFKNPLEEAFKNPGIFFSRHQVIKKDIAEMIHWHDQPSSDQSQRFNAVMRY